MAFLLPKMSVGKPTKLRGWIPDDVKVGTSRDELHLLELHDVLKLYANLPGLAQEFRV
jgi:hypothetical protein